MTITPVFIVKIIKYMLIFVICILFFISLLRIIPKTEKLGPQAAKAMDDSFKKRGIMAKQKTMLSKLGIAYRAGNYNLNPSWYIMARCATGVVGALLIYAAMQQFSILMLAGFMAGFIGLDMYYKRANTADNKAMMMDLYNTYANLKIQLNSGIYITDSLSYSHRVAQNERFREALGELILNMADKTISTSNAIDIFKDRFDSREIDKLCALLQNYAQYGASESYAADIMGEINSIITASTLESEHDIESKAGMVNFAFFACIIALTAYSVFTQFNGMDMFF